MEHQYFVHLDLNMLLANMHSFYARIARQYFCKTKQRSQRNSNSQTPSRYCNPAIHIQQLGSRYEKNM
jgi:hypothetical protein